MTQSQLCHESNLLDGVIKGTARLWDDIPCTKNDFWVWVTQPQLCCHLCRWWFGTWKHCGQALCITLMKFECILKVHFEVIWHNCNCVNLWRFDYLILPALWADLLQPIDDFWWPFDPVWHNCSCVTMTDFHTCGLIWLLVGRLSWGSWWNWKSFGYCVT